MDNQSWIENYKIKFPRRSEVRNRYSFRPVEPEDWGALEELDKKVYGEHALTKEKLMNMPDVAFIVVDFNGKVIGYEIIKAREGTKEIEFIRIVVDPAHSNDLYERFLREVAYNVKGAPSYEGQLTEGIFYISELDEEMIDFMSRWETVSKLIKADQVPQVYGIPGDAIRFSFKLPIQPRSEVRSVYPSPIPYGEHPWVIQSGLTGPTRTQLLRWRTQLHEFKDSILPRIFSQQGPKKRLKISSLGVHTGEEVASVFYALVEAFKEHPEWGEIDTLELKWIVNDLDRGILDEARNRLHGRSPFVFDARVVNMNLAGKMGGVNKEPFTYIPQTFNAIVQTVEGFQNVFTSSLRFLAGSIFTKRVLQEAAGSHVVFANATGIEGNKGWQQFKQFWQEQDSPPIIITTEVDAVEGLNNYVVTDASEFSMTSYFAIPASLTQEETLEKKPAGSEARSDQDEAPQALIQELINTAEEAEQAIKNGDSYGLSDMDERASELIDQIEKRFPGTPVEGDYMKTLIKIHLVFPVSIDPTIPAHDKDLGVTEVARKILFDESFIFTSYDETRVNWLPIAERLGQYREPLSRTAAQKKLNHGSGIVIRSLPNLEALRKTQRKYYHDELSFAAFPNINEKVSLVVLTRDLLSKSFPKFYNIAPVSGHTHAFSTPLEPSEGDSQVAKKFAKVGIETFILAFDEDGHVELAVYRPDAERWKIERENQDWIVEQLQAFGVLSKPSKKSKKSARKSARSELRIAASPELVSKAPSTDPNIRDIMATAKGSYTLIVDAKMLNARSELRAEAYAVAHQMQALEGFRLIIVNALELSDKLYSQFAKLKNVQLVLGDYEEAIGRYGRKAGGKIVRLVGPETVEAIKGVSQFFWGETTDIWGALIWALSDEAVFGINKVKGVYRVVGQMLKGLINTFRNTLFVGMSA